MLKAKDIREAAFATAMSGYKKDEVDLLLDKVLEDYQQFDAVVASQQTKIAALEKELADKDISMNSINTVLISAQKLADSIVADAKKQAEETVETANAEAESIKLRTKKALEEIDAVLTEQKNKAQAEVDQMLSDAARKSEGMILAAKDSVTREQLLFDKLKSEVAEFKAQIKETYKAHIESISKLPEEVVLSPELAASTIEDIINKEPDLLKFIEKTPIEEEIEPATTVAFQPEPEVEPEVIPEADETPEETVDMDATAIFTPVSVPEEKAEPVKGFVIQELPEEEEEKSAEEEEKPTFGKGFFAKHK